MSKVDVALVDEHFMHGKVALNLCSTCNSRLIIVVNDDLVNDKTQQGLLEMAIPDDIKVRYYSIEKAKSKLISDDKKSSVIIVKNIEDLVELFQANVSIPKVLLSSLPHKPGQKELDIGVSVSSGEIESLEEMFNTGTEIFMGTTLDERPKKLNI